MKAEAKQDTALRAAPLQTGLTQSLTACLGSSSCWETNPRESKPAGKERLCGVEVAACLWSAGGGADAVQIHHM